MKQLKNEQGLTLIEVLATMTILLVIGGLFYGVLTQVFTNFDRSEKKITARQEANLIIAQLTTIHQKSNSYAITYETENFFTTETDSAEKMKLGHKNYTYELKVGDKELNSLSPIKIDLTTTKSVDIELTLSNSQDEFTITTTLSRMTKAK